MSWSSGGWRIDKVTKSVMQVFIENEAGSDRKNLYNEKTLEFRKVIRVSREYPFPYGFILGTTSGDGDNLDCFIITEKKLRTGQVVECDPIGMMEQSEDGKEDLNVLAALLDNEVSIDEETKGKLVEFISHVFDHRPDKVVRVGHFLGKDEAISLVGECLD